MFPLHSLGDSAFMRKPTEPDHRHIMSSAAVACRTFATTEAALLAGPWTKVGSRRRTELLMSRRHLRGEYVQGRPSPLRPWCTFPSVSDFLPYFRKNFRLRGKFSKFYLSLKILSIFVRQNFCWPFFSHQISSFPCFGTLSPCFAKIIIPPPYFQKFPPVFPKFTSFLHTFCVFRFPLL